LRELDISLLDPPVYISTTSVRIHLDGDEEDDGVYGCARKDGDDVQEVEKTMIDGHVFSSQCESRNSAFTKLENQCESQKSLVSQIFSVTKRSISSPEWRDVKIRTAVVNF
jgi:hypothetical protein